MSRGMLDLEREVLAPPLARFLEQACEGALGPKPWVIRKRAEAFDLCAMAQRSPRLTLVGLDLSTELRALLRLEVPVATRPDGEELVIADHADLVLIYPMHALRAALPGYAFVRVLSPGAVWHPNVARDSGGQGQALCLGTQVPAGLPVRELVLASYGALAMQTLQVDERDAAGVMNLEAARWWQLNFKRAPLTRAGLMCPLEQEAD
jgi:hypothetical protein